MNLSLKVQPAQLVARHDQKITTTTTIIAEAFQKPHKDVLAKIRSLDCSEDFRERNFSPTSELIQAGAVKREREYYEITKDGFMFLVMGFTGKKAAAWKEAFINAFNAMQAQLSGEIQLPSQKLCEYKDQIIALQNKVIDLSEDLAAARLPKPRAPRRNTKPLTDTERDLILALVEKGHSQAAIARQLDRSTALISLFLSGYRTAQEQLPLEVKHG